MFRLNEFCQPLVVVIRFSYHGELLCNCGNLRTINYKYPLDHILSEHDSHWLDFIVLMAVYQNLDWNKIPYTRLYLL